MSVNSSRIGSGKGLVAFAWSLMIYRVSSQIGIYFIHLDMHLEKPSAKWWLFALDLKVLQE